MSEMIHGGWEGASYLSGAAADMTALKMAIIFSRSGTGQVEAVIRNATFAPRHSAFTSLLHLASKARDPAKALEIFEAMQTVAGVSPNTFNYSALISALGKAGRYDLAIKYFDELKGKGRQDPNMWPNTITYAAMISAYDKRGCKEGLEQAVALFEEQRSLGIPVDLITYSSLIAACERAGEINMAVDFLDQMHAAGFTASIQVYNRLIASCSRNWNLALELFLGMQCVQVDLTASTADLLFGILVGAGEIGHAMWLLKESTKEGWILSMQSYRSLLECLAKKDDVPAMKALLLHMDMHTTLATTEVTSWLTHGLDGKPKKIQPNSSSVPSLDTLSISNKSKSEDNVAAVSEKQDATETIDVGEGQEEA